MLKVLSRKLCPLLSLALAAMGCGKKITEGSTESAHNRERQELPSALVLKLTPEDERKVYEIPKNANVFFPDALWVRSGDPTGQTVVISYNLKDADGNDYEYRCTYESSAATTVMPLKECLNAFGDSFTDVTRFDFPLSYGSFIRMELQGEGGIEVDAVYTVAWI